MHISSSNYDERLEITDSLSKRTLQTTKEGLG